MYIDLILLSENAYTSAPISRIHRHLLTNGVNKSTGGIIIPAASFVFAFQICPCRFPVVMIFLCWQILVMHMTLKNVHCMSQVKGLYHTVHNQLTCQPTHQAQPPDDPLSMTHIFKKILCTTQSLTYACIKNK